jgi:tetratricopeptide (TPR) repeat protein
MNDLLPVVGGLLSRAFSLHQNNQLEQAAQLYRAALQMQPNQPDALHLLGALEADRGHDQLAIDLIERALRANPGLVEARLNLGASLRRLKRFEEALASYDEALKMRPDFADAHFNRGNILQDLKRFDEACASYMSATALQPDFAEAFNNCGSIYWKAARFDEAWHCYDKVVALRPGYATGWVNLGSACEKLGRTEEALSCYHRAQKIEPDNVVAHWNESHCLLMLGDYEHGWEKYEWRWKGPQANERRAFTQPQWQGEMPLQGKTIMLHAEQGLGDTLQFCRYASKLAALGAEVLMEVQPPLVALLKSLPGASRVIPRGEALPHFDYHSPIVSLPYACKTTLDTVPSQSPYVFADTALVDAWQSRLGDRRGLRVGIVWTTTTTIGNKRIPLAEIAALIGLDIELFSMQKDMPDTDRASLGDYPMIRAYGDEFSDFSQTAAFAALMDIVVSVDTAVAHVAAAMGKPTCILLPHVADWRWMKTRTDTPWYPSARLFRQPASGDWRSVMNDVVAAVRAFNKSLAPV